MTCGSTNAYQQHPSCAVYLANLEKRLFLLPIIWAAFGLGEVFGLRYLFGPILDFVPYGQNDKPIGGSVLPVLFFNVAVLLGVIGVSLYSLGFWKVDLSIRKTRADVIALSVLLASGFLFWYVPVALFSGVAALVYFLATNLE